ncbi:MAG: hypothetical protein HYV14_03205 [Elusimicrobia bacterium]|nr:hypothetical protein [Elusimicrobiota bacterium]
MANNEDVNQANQGAPAADIPDLKKKEKERKKAGAAWGGAKPGGGSFSGATGGTVARSAASAASSAGGAAGAAAGAAQAAGASWLSSTIAALTATAMGKMLVAAGVAIFLAGAGLFAYSLFNGAGADGAGGIGDLGSIASSMKIRSGDVDRTGYVASNGEIMFDPIKAAEAKKAAAEEKAPEDKTAGEAVPPDAIADAAGKGGDWNRPGLEHNLSGAKLSSSLGGGFGGKNIFAGNSAAPKFNDALSKANIKGGEKGRLSASRSSRTGRTVKGGKAKSMKANKAFGQLKVAKGMSALGAGTSATEGAAATAANAFDGGQGAGNVVGSPTAPTGAVDSPSTPNGAPDMTAPSVDTPTGTLMDPDNAQALSGIAALAKAAGEMKKKAEQMMMMGLALIAAGAAIMAMASGPWAPIVIAIGLMIIGIGVMLVSMSNMMKKQAEMMKNMAESASQMLAARTSDVKQNEINQYCIDKAYADGTNPKDCNPPDSVTENRQTIENDNSAVERHKDMVKETGRVEGVNGKPTGQ